MKALKTAKLVFLPRLYCHVNKMPPPPHIRRHDQNNHLVTSIAAALNWSGNAMIRGFSYSTDGLLNGGPTALTCGSNWQMMC